MLRRFKKLCEKEGLTKDIKRRQYFEKPSERRRRDQRKNVGRVLRGPGGTMSSGSSAGGRPSRSQRGPGSGPRSSSGPRGAGGRSRGPRAPRKSDR
jgi:small subunit ribosomal protein S21